MIWALHGFLGQGSDWNPFLDIGGAWRTPDLLNASIFGLSLEAYAEKLVRTIEAIDPKPTLVGYSMGGRLALRVLLARPRLFRRAVIVSASLGVTDRERRYAQDDLWARRFEHADWSLVERDWNAQPVFQGQAPAFLRPEPLDRRPLVWVLRHWSPARQDAIESRLHEIKIPVLWIAGERDRAYVDCTVQAATQLPQVETWIAPGVGHRVPWECEPAFKTRLRGFLEQDLASSRDGF